MALKFKKGDVVEVKVVVPSGPVIDFRLDSDGEMWYLIEWPDEQGVPQQRWFKEDALKKAT